MDSILKKAFNMENFQFFLSYTLGPLKKTLEELQKKSVKGEGLTFFVDNEGILNVTYDDGTEEGEEETE